MEGEAAARLFYVDAAVRRMEAGGDPDLLIRAEGLYGVKPTAQGNLGRMLVVDDAAESYLRTIADQFGRYGFSVFGNAPRCIELLSSTELDHLDATAMVCRDIGQIPRSPLPDGLRVERVQRLSTDPTGVPLEVAVEALVKADPEAPPAPKLAQFLRTQPPPSTQLFAAVDAEGAVRATSGSFVLAGEACVIFVATDSDWRNHGVGTAMTAWALEAARHVGAQSACLDATAAGLPIYERLGFEGAGPISLFMHF